MPNSEINIGSPNDPKQATERFLKKSKVAGLTPDQAVKHLDLDEFASSWTEARQIVFDYFRAQMNGGDNV